jgi:hypothetical protein
MDFSSSLPQGFSLYQSALGAQVQFFPAVGTKELDDMINAYSPGPGSIQEKRANITVDFLSHAQVTGQTFKFYPVYSVDSPASDSFSSFNPSPAASWDWSQASGPASVSSARSPVSARKSPVALVSRHQTADFSHLPGMKIMTKDGTDVTNSVSRGSKTKEQRDHAHLMRVIKACDSCKRKKTRCDPSHKKRTAASQPQSQASRPIKKVAKAAPPRAQEARRSPPVVAEDAFSIQAPLGWDASFTFADIDFTMPFEPVDELAAAFIPEDYDFFLDPQGYLSPQTSFASSSSSSSSASASKQSSPSSQLLGESSLGSEVDFANSLEYVAPSQLLNSGSSANVYDDFNLYSPASSFSEDENMVSIEASSERFSTKSQSQSPTNLSPSLADLPQPSPDGVQDGSWYNDGCADVDGVASTHTQSSRAAAAENAVLHATAVAPDPFDEFYDAEWLCEPRPQEPWRIPSRDNMVGAGVSNGDLMAAYESSVSSDGIAHTNRRVRTENDSSTISSGVSSRASRTENDSSTISSGVSSRASRTENDSSTISSGASSSVARTVRIFRSCARDHQLMPQKEPHSSITSSGRYSTTTETVRIWTIKLLDWPLTVEKDSGIHRGTMSVEASLHRHLVRRGEEREFMSDRRVLTAKKVTTGRLAALSELPGRTKTQEELAPAAYPSGVIVNNAQQSHRMPSPAVNVLQVTRADESPGAAAEATAGSFAPVSEFLRSTPRPGSGRYQSGVGSGVEQPDIVGPSRTASPSQPGRLRQESSAHVYGRVDVALASSASPGPHLQPAAVSATEGDSVYSLQNPAGGMRKPAVIEMALVSCPLALAIGFLLAMFVASLLASWSVMRNPTVASMMLSLSAVVLRPSALEAKDNKGKRSRTISHLYGSRLSQTGGVASWFSSRGELGFREALAVGRLLAF